VELSVDGVDPCSLLTTGQRAKLGVAAGHANPQSTVDATLRGPSCTWLGVAEHPDNGYTGGLVLNHGAEFALGGEPLRSVDGFAATTITSTGSDPNYFCGVLIDIAPGKALDADYSNDAKDYPRMNRQLACSKALDAAAAMLTTLRAQQNR